MLEISKIIPSTRIYRESRPVGKPTMWFPNRPDTNRPVQAQTQARSLKFWIYKVEELHYPCSENEGVISFAVTAKLICAFVFAYAYCWFSHVAAHMMRSTNFQPFQNLHKVLCRAYVEPKCSLFANFTLRHHCKSSRPVKHSYQCHSYQT